MMGYIHPPKKEMLLFATIGMDINDITLSEISQTKTNTMSHIQNLKK